MDLALFTRNRLKQLRLSPRDLARASKIAESSIAQLQTASNRTHIHDQLERVLQLPPGELARFAHLERRENLKKRLEYPCSPLLHRRVGTDSPLNQNIIL